ncbi:2-phosphosulfolactate phosphatase, partial [Streptomyces decoyicus]
DPGPYQHRAHTTPAAHDQRSGRRRGAHPTDVELCLEADRFDFAMKVGLDEGLAVLRPLRTRSCRAAATS